MKTEAQIIRELMESLLRAGTVDLEEIYDAKETNGRKVNMPNQRSTYEQLLDMIDLATKNGLYDAADWLKNQLKQGH